MARSKVIAALLVVVLVAQPIAPIVATTAAASNTAPTPEITGPRIVGQYVNYTYTAKDSTDDQTSVENMTFSWDIDGDGSFEAQGLNVTKSWGDPGDYQITLKAEDAGGLTNTTTINISVAPEYEGEDSAAEKHDEEYDLARAMAVYEGRSGTNPIDSITAYSPQIRESMMYQSGLDEIEDRDAFLQIYENYGGDAKALASQDAKYAIAEAYREGYDRQYAGDAALDAIQDRFSRMQLVVIERWEARVAQFNYHVKLAAQDDDFPNIGGGAYYYCPTFNHYEWNNAQKAIPIGETTTVTVTLANGSTTTAEVPEVWWEYQSCGQSSCYGWYEGYKGLNPFDHSYKRNTGGDFKFYERATIRPNNQSLYPQRNVLDTNEWSDMFFKLNQSSAEISSQYANATIDAIWNALDSGRVNASEVYSAETMYREMSGDDPANMTDYNLQIANLATLGLEHPDLDNTSKMTIHVEGVVLPKPVNTTDTLVTRVNNVSTTSQTIDTGTNMTLANNKVWGVFAEFEDGSEVRIPRSEWSMKNDTAIAVTTWPTAGEFGNLSNVSVRIITSSKVDELPCPCVNKTYTGMLFADNLPSNGQWEVGKTYYTGNIDGMEQIATFNGPIVEFEGQFTIESAYEPDGTEVQNISWTEHSYDVESSDDFVNQTERIERIVTDLIERENRATSGGAGGGTGGDSSASIDFSWPSIGLPSIGGIPGSAAIVVVILLVILLLAAL